jgi:hypothetical protein
LTTPYITTTDVKARLSSDMYARVFDRNADGTSIEIDAFCTQCIADAESEINMRTRAYLTQYFNSNGATVDPAVISYEIDVVCMHAVKRYPSAQGERDAPFYRSYKLAMDFFDRLAKDDRNRLITSAGGRAEPVGNVNNVQQVDGTFNQPFGRSADGKDPSGF